MVRRRMRRGRRRRIIRFLQPCLLVMLHRNQAHGYSLLNGLDEFGFDPDRKDDVTAGDDCYDLVNGGLAWEFYHHFMWLLVYERIMYDKNNGGVGEVPVEGNDLADDWRVQTVLQINF